MKKKNVKIICSIIIILMMVLVPEFKVKAVTIPNDKTEKIKNLMYTIKSEGINSTLLAEAINTYRDLSKEFSNYEISEMLEENKKDLLENGISSEEIDSMNNILKNVDEKQLNKVLDKINIEEITKQLKSGNNLQQIVQNAVSNLSIQEKFEFIVDLLLSAYILKTVFTIIGIMILYSIIIRCIIFKKAGRKMWEALIPLYNHIIMLKISGMSPWWLLLMLLPIIGWSFLLVVKVVSKFLLAEKFGKGELFGLGMWIFPIIFETILAFSKKAKYQTEEEI